MKTKYDSVRYKFSFKFNNEMMETIQGKGPLNGLKLSVDEKAVTTITSIGLYDNSNNLVAVAKISPPTRKHSISIHSQLSDLISKVDFEKITEDKKNSFKPHIFEVTLSCS
jgi:hypothetical protein